MKFIHVTYNVVIENWDTEVEMKLFDKAGNLILNVRHNTTKGNSYFMPPTTNRTIDDGTQGAVKRLAKELGLIKQTAYKMRPGAMAVDEHLLVAPFAAQGEEFFDTIYNKQPTYLYGSTFRVEDLPRHQVLFVSGNSGTSATLGRGLQINKLLFK